MVPAEAGMSGFGPLFEPTPRRFARLPRLLGNSAPIRLASAVQLR
jgi:hypothetical protein